MIISPDDLLFLESTKKDLSLYFENYAILLDAFNIKVKLRNDISPTINYYEQILQDETYETYYGCKNKSLVSCAWLFLRANQPSIIAPAYNYNQMVDNEIAYIKNTEDNYHYFDLDFCTYIAAMQNCLSSIKTGLDRLVKLLSLYYKGISTSSTFGHEKSEGKYTGLLSYAYQQQDNDELLKYILEQYDYWIKDCVASRDTITHYNDLVCAFSGMKDRKLLIPAAMSKAHNAGTTSQILKPEDISWFVDMYYEMITRIHEYLLLDKRYGLCELYGITINEAQINEFLHGAFNPFDDKKDI